MNISQLTRISNNLVLRIHIKRSYFICPMLSKPKIDFQVLNINSICQRIL